MSQATEAGLTTHVLDLSQGAPAVGIGVELERFVDEDPADEQRTVRLKRGITNDDGRLDHPLLTASEMETGIYQLLFDAGGYYDGRIESPAFLAVIPVRFRITDRAGHYHIPLLLSPGGYSTYRGS